jgi:hypothetical protein
MARAQDGSTARRPRRAHDGRQEFFNGSVHAIA